MASNLKNKIILFIFLATSIITIEATYRFRDLTLHMNYNNNNDNYARVASYIAVKNNRREDKYGSRLVFDFLPKGLPSPGSGPSRRGNSKDIVQDHI